MWQFYPLEIVGIVRSGCSVLECGKLEDGALII